MKKFKLELELIPEGSWYISLARLLPKEVWDSLRKEVYFKNRYTCQICGSSNVELHCHEHWSFDDKKGIQKLDSLMCICRNCHLVKHWGGTVSRVHEGKLPRNILIELTKHFCEVNDCSPAVFENHKVEAGNLYQKRSRRKYKVDFGIYDPETVKKLWKDVKKSKKDPK